ncbi:non-ribosomal peptide synthetase [Planobispora siamensis]|uniref:Carrier domain-containing protein n=1 Tax=Planobispora siamensis TaxID=936338 RepID=A0A8J3WNS2_9ACTN|nr:non-ribosomal peptide synthetase [Planobispora siamensis]GIH97684.1 hypothetical protein Psi01_83140 [Planobispora siamensis]
MTDRPAPLPRRAPGTPIPLTPAQSRLWFLDRAGHGGPAYLCGANRLLSGRLDEEALIAAMAAVMRQHEVLRVSIADGPAGPVQIVHDLTAAECAALCEISEVEGATAQIRRERAGERAREFHARGFRLDRPPLQRVLLLRLGPHEHLLMWSLHHIVCDGPSLALLMQEVFERYAALLSGAAETRPPAAQFTDYAAWLAARRAPAHERDRAFWAGYLRGAPVLQSVPADRPRPAGLSSDGCECRVELPQGLTGRLRELARRERCTPFTIFMAAMTATLARHSGEDDIVVGSVAAERDLPDLENAVGFFVNTLPIRTRLPGDPSLLDVLGEARSSLLRALTHRSLPFEEIVEAAAAPRELNRNPLFQTMLVFEQDTGEAERSLPDLTAAPWDLPPEVARFDLNVMVTLGPRARLNLTYSTGLYEPETIERFGGHLVRMLEAMADDLGQRLWRVPLLDERERDLVGAGVLRRGPGRNGEEAEEPADRRQAPQEPEAPVHELIAARAAQRPDAPAVITPEGEISYGELEERVRHLAARLRVTAALGPGTPVGIVLPTGPEAVVAILAALRAGGAYLPLNPADPADRNAAILAEAAVPVVIADTAPPGYRGVLLSPAHPADDAPMVPAAASGARDLAYVIYTSGSTGRPKGVMVTHGTLARFTRSFRDDHGLTSGDRIWMVPPLTFDASVGDLFPALTSGAALVLHPEPARVDGAELVAFCSRHRVSVVDAPVSLWRQWAEDLSPGRVPTDWPVRLMTVGGERVPVRSAQAWAEATSGRVTLVNHYGPTEATVCATTWHVTARPSGEEHLPIGRPLPHVRAYVLDRAGGLTPAGAPGELYLGGDCLARGYLGDPQATARSFVPDPFSGRPGDRMYRTGDLARYRHDGTLQFLGRIDRQVKVRGHRVEPAEVEAAVTAHPAVRDAAVLADGDRLVAYVAPAPVPLGELRRFLRERLPAALVPGVLVPLERIPRTAHGKVDQAALPPPAEPPADGGHVPPQGPVERALSAIWARVIGIGRVGRSDNFFALGGTSLLAARVLGAVERELGARLPLGALFETADLAALAELVLAAGSAASAGPGHDPMAAVLRAETLPPQVLARTPRHARPETPPRVGAETSPQVHVSGAPHRVPGSGAPAHRPPGTILVTGATGFLGAHLVAELLCRTTATVVCLVRAATPQQALQRVRANLRTHGYGPGLALHRLVGVPGDLGSEHFGMDPAAFAELAARVEAVCHNGGLVHFAEPYARLRPVNVGGTIEVLRLAALGGASVHAVSTLGVYLTPSWSGRGVSENDPPDDPAGLPGPYEQSKWAADRLARAARRAGLGVSVHRPARVSGHSRSGRGNPGDYFIRMLLTFAQLGQVPDLPHAEDLAPVDYVAAAIAHLVADPAATGRDFHYFNSATVGYPEIAAALTARGHPVELVPWTRWRAALHDSLAAGREPALAPFITMLPEAEPQPSRPGFDCSATERTLAAAGIVCPPADGTLLGVYLDALTADGRLRRAARA